MSNKVTKITLKESKELFSTTMPNYVRFAVSNTLTKIAYKSMVHSEKWIKKNWELRNSFLLGSGHGKGAVKYQGSKPSHNINNIFSKYGSVDKVGSKDYKFMEDQEDGFKVKGSTPTLKARPSKNYSKRIPSRNRRRKSNIENLRGSMGSKRMTVIHLRRLFKRGFALPGSNQFFYMKDNKYSNFSAGLYQFSRKVKPKKLTKSGRASQFPNLKKMYGAGKDQKKTRKAAKWMQKSSKKLNKREVDDIFNKAANQAFSGQLKKWK